MVRARREAMVRDRLSQQAPRRRLDRRGLLHLATGELGIAPALALELHRVGARHPLAHGGRPLAIPGVEELLFGERRHFHVHVDAVQERAGDAVAIARDRKRRAVALAVVVAEVSAWAWTRCSFAGRVSNS